MRRSASGWAARLRVPLGFAFAAAFLILSRPTRGFLIAGGLVALAGLLLRALSAGYIRKNETLSTAGPFRYTRNPLYFGSFLLGLGFIIAGASLVLGIAFAVLFALIYVPVMRSEEEYMRYLFGQAYDEYRDHVPRFFPLPWRRAAGNGEFRWRRYWKNREYEAALGWTAIFIFLILKLVLR